MARPASTVIMALPLPQPATGSAAATAALRSNVGRAEAPAIVTSVRFMSVSLWLGIRLLSGGPQNIVGQAVMERAGGLFCFCIRSLVSLRQVTGPEGVAQWASCQDVSPRSPAGREVSGERSQKRSCA